MSKNNVNFVIYKQLLYNNYISLKNTQYKNMN